MTVTTLTEGPIMQPLQQCPFMHGRVDDAPVSGAQPPRDMRYSDYLRLDAILDGQQPLSDIHDEMLFIIQHQTTELWMKLLLHELTRACALVREGCLQQAGKVVFRAQRAMEHLVHAWNVLATLSPVEFLAMRPHLGSSSGHQSSQFREIEFILGNKNRELLREHGTHEKAFRTLHARLRAPSLYDEVVGAMAARGLDISPARLNVDPDLPTRHDASVQAAWTAVYRAPDAYWDLYDLGERLVDLEDGFRQWRFRHVTTVERVIGLRRGTGGSDGASYLRRTLDIVLFPELWHLRTAL